ncbi:hypothetical protein B5G33_20250 [Blautia sp. An81]|nr:hypothetical protein B5G33_20250 [Blautia sp. An81]
MKKFFLDHHHEIDVFSSGLLLYFLFVCLFLFILSSLKNEIFHATLSLLLPILFLKSQIIYKFNNLLHKIFRFRR